MNIKNQKQIANKIKDKKSMTKFISQYKISVYLGQDHNVDITYF